MESKTDLVLQVARQFLDQTGRRDFSAVELPVPDMSARSVRHVLRSCAIAKKPKIAFSRQESGTKIAKQTFYRFVEDEPVVPDERITPEMAANTLSKLWGLVAHPVSHATLVPLFSRQADD